MFGTDDHRLFPVLFVQQVRGLGPEVLQDLQVVTPNGWSLRAFTDAAADRATLGDVGLAVVVLVAIGVVFGAVGLARIHRTLVP